MPAITLTEPVDEALHGGLGHPERLGKGGVGDVLAFGAEARAQRLKGAKLALAFTFLAQTAHGVFDDSRGPAQIEEPLGWPRLEGPGGNGEL